MICHIYSIEGVKRLQLRNKNKKVHYSERKIHLIRLDLDLYPGWQALDADPEIVSGPATELLSVEN